MATQAHKIILVGEGGVGKTTYINRYLNGDFTKAYVATLGVDVNPILFETNRGLACLNIWDCAGQERFGGMGSGYFTGAKGAIVMFDTRSILSFRSIDSWVAKIRETCGDIPVVLCGNKVDIPERKIQSSQTKHVTLGLHKYYDISVKGCYNTEKPFLSLLRKLEGDEAIAFDV